MYFHAFFVVLIMGYEIIFFYIEIIKNNFEITLIRGLVVFCSGRHEKQIASFGSKHDSATGHPSNYTAKY